MPTRDYNSIVISRELLTKIFSHITIQGTGYKTPCWLWHPHNLQQYSSIMLNRVNYGVHRLMYALFVGHLYEELHCDHLCRVPSCVNPAHIDPVTPRENILRGIGIPAVNVKKTHCPQGHPYEGDNLYEHPTSGRTCKICKRNLLKNRIEYHAKYRRKRGMKERSKTHCHRGHPFNSENTYIIPTTGGKQCRICQTLNRSEKRRQKTTPK